MLYLCCREKSLKWNGWGYSDSGFLVNEKGQATFEGKRLVNQMLLIKMLHQKPDLAISTLLWQKNIFKRPAYFSKAHRRRSLQTGFTVLPVVL